MNKKREWETRSLECIHKVREEIDAEISEKGMKLSEWVESHVSKNVGSRCEKLGLKNVKIVKSSGHSPNRGGKND